MLTPVKAGRHTLVGRQKEHDMTTNTPTSYLTSAHRPNAPTGYAAEGDTAGPCCPPT